MVKRALLILGSASLIGAALYAPPSVAAPDPANPLEVGEPVSAVRSPALRSLPVSKPGKEREVPEGQVPGTGPTGGDRTLRDNATGPVQTEVSDAPADLVPVNSFAGGTTDSFAGQASAFVPPDTVGDVGPNHYVQMVNSTYQIWNKQGTSLAGPTNINALWSGYAPGTPCRETNDGDPIVLYDQAANRWMLAQFSVNGASYQMCIAYSTSANPTGTYWTYAIPMTAFPDYEKFGIWPDGLYMTTYENANLGVFAFDRAAMLSGGSVTFLKGTIPSGGGPRVQRILPADWDGTTAPPVGAPNPFLMSVDSAVQGGASDRLELYNFHVDWATPANSTFTLAQTLPTAPFSVDIGSSCMGDVPASFRECVPQPGTATKVDDISNRLMWRLQYRNFGDHASMVTNQTVNSGSNRAAIRWYELRKTGANWAIHQQSTFAPADTSYRWMGSAAMDKAGNIALGYSISNATAVFPSINYTGRRAGAPLNQMSEPETRMFTGVASQTASSRWGDYSAMSVDPVDDCTFWYTQMHIGVGGSRQTRIGTARFTSCAQPTAQLKLVAKADPSSLNPNLWTVKAEAAAPLEGKNLSNAGGAGTLQSVYAGTPYTLSQTGGPSNYSGDWVCATNTGAAVPAPGGVVTLAAGSQVTCTITNSRDSGSLAITKQFDPQGSGYSGTFDVQYACTEGATPGPSGTLPMKAGETRTVPGVPTGSVCTVSEPTLPANLAGWAFNPATFSPVDGKASITTKGQTASVTVVNSVTAATLCPIKVKLHKPVPKTLGKRTLTDKASTTTACSLPKPKVSCKKTPKKGGSCKVKATKKGKITVKTTGLTKAKVKVIVTANPTAASTGIFATNTWRKTWTLK